MKRMMFFSILLVVILAACSKSPFKNVIVKVNGMPIYQEEVDYYLSQMNPQMRAYYSTPQGYQQLIDRLVQNKLLYQEALRRKLNEKPEVQLMFQNLKEQVLINALVDEIKKENATLSDTVMQQYFQEHRNEFDTVPRATVSAVRTSSKELAQKVYSDLKRGSTITELKQKYAKEKGFWAEDLGDIKQGSLTPDMDKVIFSLPKGGVSKIIERNNNFFIFKIMDRKEAEDLNFKDFKEDIATKLSAQSLDKRMKQLIDSLTAKANIKYFFKK